MPQKIPTPEPYKFPPIAFEKYGMTIEYPGLAGTDYLDTLNRLTMERARQMVESVDREMYNQMMEWSIRGPWRSWG